MGTIGLVESQRWMGRWGRELVGPALAVAGVLLLRVVLGPVALLPLAALSILAVACWVGLTQWHVGYSLFLVYLLFETVVAAFLPPPLPLLSKDLAYLGVMGLGLLVAVVASSRADGPRPAPGTAAVLLYMCFMLLLALRGPSLLLGALGFRATAYYGLVAVLAPLAYARGGGRRFSLALLSVGLCVVAAVGIYEFLNWEAVREALELEEQRWTMDTLKAGATVGSPGAFGAVMALGLLFLLARALEGDLSRRAWLMGCAMGALWLTGLILSFSRISQIGFVMVAFVLLLRRRRLLVPGLILLLLLGLVANVLTAGFLVGNLLATVGRGEHLDAIQSTEDRVEIVRLTLLERMPEHPWLGHGLGSSGAPTRERLEQAPFGYLFLDNMYLKSALEGGAVGLAAYLALLVASLLAGLRAVARVDAQGGPCERAAIRAATGGVLFFALAGVASTVHEMPVVNSSFWWCVGWILWAASLKGRGWNGTTTRQAREGGA